MPISEVSKTIANGKAEAAIGGSNSIIVSNQINPTLPNEVLTKKKTVSSTNDIKSAAYVPKNAVWTRDIYESGFSCKFVSSLIYVSYLRLVVT